MKKCLSLYACLLFVLGCRHIATAQNIYAYAGVETAGYNGDGIPATDAQLYGPMHVGVDRLGNIYIGDQGNNRVRKVSPSGIMTTIAGNGTYGYSGDGGAATAAELRWPWAVAIDATDNIYIADFSNNVIRKINAGGVISTVAGNGIQGNSGDHGPATAAELFYPNGLAFDAIGNLYISCNQNTVRKVDTFGIITTIAGNGTAGFRGDGGPATAALINAPKDITVDQAGNIYFAEDGNNIIRKINTSGIISTAAGNRSQGYTGDGGPATAAQLWNPESVACDRRGNVFISDYGNHVVRKINTNGIISTIAGNGTLGNAGDGGPATAASICYGYGIAAYGQGNMYVTSCNRIRLLDNTPFFINGAAIIFPACSNTSTPINTLLAANDSDIAQTETWSVNLPPLHGTLAGFNATTISTGGMVAPAGLSYTPAGGYTGPDTFSVNISDGFATATTTVYVTVNPSPTAPLPITGPASVCAGSTITLSDGTPGGVWGSANAVATVSPSGDVSGIAGGTDTIYYTITAGGCSSAVSKTIAVTPTIAPSITISNAAGDTVCTGSTVIYTAIPVNGGSSPTYQWKVNGIVSGAATTYSFVPANNDVISCTLTSNAACAVPVSATQTHTITASPHLMPSVTFTSDDGDTVCQGTPLVFTAIPVYGGAAPTYSWLVNYVYRAAGNPFHYTPKEGDLVQCIMLSNLDCRAKDSAYSPAINMVVMPFIQPSVAITGAGGKAIRSGQVDTLLAIVTNGGTNPTFQWELNRIMIPGATDSKFVKTFADHDTVTCIVTSGGVCQESAYTRIIITKNGYGGNIILFPNPNFGTINLKGDVNVANQSIAIDIIDVLGRVVFRGQAPVSTGGVDAQFVLDYSVANAVYFARITAIGLSEAIKFTLMR